MTAATGVCKHFPPLCRIATERKCRFHFIYGSLPVAHTGITEEFFCSSPGIHIVCPPKQGTSEFQVKVHSPDIDASVFQAGEQGVVMNLIIKKQVTGIAAGLRT